MIQCYAAREEPKRIREAEARLLRSEELKLIEETAYHDEGIGAHSSVGETDAMLSSKLLDIEQGDVLRDPKIRSYIHPSLKRRSF